MNFSVEIKKHKKTRRPKVKILNSSSVRVLLPPYYPRSFAQKIINEHEGWIVFHLDKLQTKERKAQEKIKNNRGKLQIFGEWIPFTVDPTQRKKAIFQDNISLRSIDCKKDLYKDIGKEFFQERTHHYATQVNKKYGKISLREQKTLWGSCSYKGNISYNIKLIQAPQLIAEYVVAHEVCHLVHKNHSANFYKLLDSLFPQRAQAELWLRENGGALHLGFQT